MKKFIYLCGMMLLSLNIMAQIDLNDPNWDTVLFDDFTIPGRYWIDSSFISSDSVWKAYSNGLTHGKNKMIYQYSHCHFNDTAGYMELVAEYARDSILAHNYHLPYTIHTYPNDTNLYYFSGRIDHYDKYGLDSAKYKYGYFEIRCKLPVHQGAFPAFWLHSRSTNSLDPYYEEIDIFEYSWSLGDPSMSNWEPFPNPNPTFPGDSRVFTTGIYHNLTGQNANHSNDSFGRNYPIIPHTSNNLEDWHVFSCEWMPDHVYWFFDGQLVNMYTNQVHIPCHPLILKTNYTINSYYNHGDSIWSGPGTMTIDYINVYQLKWDCSTDEVITCQADLDDFDYKVKKSISVTSTIDDPVVSNTGKVTFRIADFFEITGSFEVKQGGEFTLIQQACPNTN